MPKSAKPTSQGKCLLCQQVFPKAAITRHLAACRTTAYAKDMAKAKEQTVFHIVVEAKYLPEYWLHVDVAGKVTLADLDLFLKDIWLECCGHLSMFTIAGCQYSAEPEGAFFELADDCFGAEQEQSMDIAIEKVVQPKTKIGYEYDFGSTTELTLRVVAEQTMQFKGKAIRLLVRNEAPALMCDNCKTTKATKVCSQCIDEGEGWLCAKCAKKHSCGDDVLLPVVNSPRTGVCAYCG